jgi:enamine deaminase RidA (YjgF/YER057c/UK114 family)
VQRFDRFTDHARHVLVLAQEEAKRLDHDYLGTEHILLGLIREKESVAARALEGLGVELAKVRDAVEFIIGRGERPVHAEPGLTPRGKRVVELAIDQARQSGHEHIGTEHLLLGIILEGEGVAAGVLRSVGVDLRSARQEVMRILAERRDEPLDETGHVLRDTRRRITSGSPYEVTIGFSRAVRAGDRVLVSGTAPIWPDGSCDPDPGRQAARCLEIILAALSDAGAGPEDVVRTRMFITDPADADAVGRAHGEVFGEIRPAATMVVVAALLDPRWKVEIEAEAIVP